MASAPLKGDRIIAKVKLLVYLDSALSKPGNAIPPGPGGLRKNWQYPNIVENGLEVGTFTGNFTDKSYEVNYVFTIERAVKGILRWKYIKETTLTQIWVNRDQVTGGWDKGIDAPKVNTPIGVDNTTEDNTNLYLGGAIGLAIFAKFILPKLRN